MLEVGGNIKLVIIIIAGFVIVIIQIFLQFCTMNYCIVVGHLINVTTGERVNITSIKIDNKIVGVQLI